MAFVASEMLLTGVVEASPVMGVVTIFTAALNGIAILRAYMLLFTGRRHTSAVSLAITNREPLRGADAGRADFARWAASASECGIAFPGRGRNSPHAGETSEGNSR